MRKRIALFVGVVVQIIVLGPHVGWDVVQNPIADFLRYSQLGQASFESAPQIVRRWRLGFPRRRVVPIHSLAKKVHRLGEGVSTNRARATAGARREQELLSRFDHLQQLENRSPGKWR